MTDGERSFREKLALQIVIRKIDMIFAECSTFKERDKKILLEVIATLLIQHMRELPHVRANQSFVSTDEAPPKTRAVADNTPTNSIREVLLSIADLCEAELQPIKEATPPSRQ
jgi:hypothetical protein